MMTIWHNTGFASGRRGTNATSNVGFYQRIVGNSPDIFLPLQVGNHDIVISFLP